MTIQEALKSLRGWRMRPEAIDVVLAEFARMQRELQERSRADEHRDGW